jgi:hypothetical protein
MRPRTSLAARDISMRSESGSILILTALSMVLLLGVAALAVDGSFMYTERNRMWAAADAAAKSGAWEVYYGNTVPGNLNAFADHEVGLHGFSPARTGGDTEVLVWNPPITGDHIGDAGYVEVTVARNTATFFGTVLGWANLRPLARAVAGASSGPDCMVSLNHTGTSMSIGGTVHMNLNCNMLANGNLQHGNGVGEITADYVGVEGTCSSDCAGVTSGVGGGGFSDPLYYLAPPSNPYGAPTSVTIANNQPPQTITPGWYSSINIGNSDIVSFDPGLYWITGPVIIGNSAVVSGTGVMFYFAGTAAAGTCTVSSTAGCINIPNSATVDLSARVIPAGDADHRFNGILMYQAYGNHIDADFNNSGDYNLSGAMYFPDATVTYGNAGASNDCTLFVAYNINIGASGGGSMEFNNTCATFGGSPIMTISLAE